MKCKTTHELAKYLLTLEDKAIGIGNYAHCQGECAWFVSDGVVVDNVSYDFVSLEEDIDSETCLFEGETMTYIIKHYTNEEYLSFVATSINYAGFNCYPTWDYSHTYEREDATVFDNDWDARQLLESIVPNYYDFYVVEIEEEL